MNKKISIFSLIIIFLIFLLGCTNKEQNIKTVKDLNPSNMETSLEKDNKEINIINKEEIINKLCSDEFEGRLVGSLGNQLSENYISDLFKEIGLTPIFKENYKQEYSQEVYKTYGLISDDDYGETKLLNNIIGKINGNSNNAIIISAHFDHIGIQNGNIIRGAIDNASGVSVLLGLAEILTKEYSINKPEFDIIFCAFNSEETGLIGSSEFLKNINGKYKNLININIDSVGYKNGGSITFLDRNNDTSLYEPMKEIMKKNGLDVRLDAKLTGSADSIVFDKAKIPSICIIDENAKDIIHTEKDVPELIDYDRLNKIIKSIYDFIKTFTFK